MSLYFALYLACVAIDGDYLNDYLTELPWGVDYGAQLIGMALALVLGFGL